MNTIDIAGFTFSTDGSRLICHPRLKAIDFLDAMDEESIVQLSHFVVENMTWMDTCYSDYDKSLVKEAYYPIAKRAMSLNGSSLGAYSQSGIKSQVDAQSIKRDVLLIKSDKDLADIEPDISDDLLWSLCVIFHSCAPYLFSIGSDFATDGFYSKPVDNYQAYSARNYKELITSLFGSYTSTFPEIPLYILNNLSYCFKEDTDTPIEDIAEIARYLADISCKGEKIIYESDYLPFALRSQSINLTPKRFINWCRNHGAKDAIRIVAYLVEIDDCPFVYSIEASGDFSRLEKRCHRMLDLIGMEMGNRTKEHDDESFLKAKDFHYDLKRAPDKTFHNHAIYALRSAVELSGVGDELLVCVGGERYTRRLEQGYIGMYLIEDEERQYIAQVENGEVVELRGYNNFIPESEELSQVAQFCAELSNV